MYTYKNYALLLMGGAALCAACLLYKKTAFTYNNEAIIPQMLTQNQTAREKVTNDINAFIVALPETLSTIIGNTENNINTVYKKSKDAMEAKMISTLTSEESRSYFNLWNSLQNTFNNIIKNIFDNESEDAIGSEISAIDDITTTLQDIPFTAQNIIKGLAEDTLQVVQTYAASSRSALQHFANDLIVSSSLKALAEAEIQGDLIVKEHEYEVTSPQDAWDKFSHKALYVVKDAWEDIESKAFEESSEVASKTKEELIERYTESARDSIDEGVNEWLEAKQ
jgi:hypothetical protein